MRIAQVAPLWERVPPPAYGGIELVVGLLTDELVKRGHEVTLFASGDSLTLAKLVSVHPRALRLDNTVKDYSIYELLNLASVYEQSAEFDIIHSHAGHTPLAYTKLVETPTVHTLHGIFTPDNEKIFKYAKKQPYVSISDAQREPRLGLNYISTVYNGIDVSSYEFYPQPVDPPYLAFVGRISPEKGTHLAIQIAKKTGWQLKIAGKIDRVDIEYFEQEIKPQIDGKQIQYLGEANHAEKNTIMGSAYATLFPITWREPFGLVMVESMASGTPVIAMRMGSTPEVIADRETGFLCNNIQECIEAIEQIERLNRYACRRYVEKHFSIKQMTDGYEAVYKQILKEKFAQENGHFRTTLVH
ncbi:glycosyltransferase family 4 protein [Sphaerospermopsis kisseleviana CS-549]|jgi:glycosyltransferase involved in cell wall biosynthesis|uniref:Group 1 glycosyl transferase n=3 Tax=Sphaerospermopsis TaxID=752201 RepID=A0A479ZVT5_9CYAN|nr:MULTISPECIES: glycosyltransferase family 4 protein [Sphaerospermopsis]BAZ82059.1 group 1 glycosyl transferase [Sphaerospermopsis kisseleviana NIES-73]MBD2145143.1 glycosyltransferase family 4 protein [Sphaerospermopsis sp. FACHB-1194]MBE9234910.1 glycosyltransferase family 4 protein [Sphaerospermopsis aphanizomenoides LEGE 00250]MDB9442655.1 glycosyltransferase family 4 protein [Sphaerospermopsis kisseleviana CS-549]GCL35686.1 group 1 glycosyl transferase [Sphaerospermopsis reniformis]